MPRLIDTLTGDHRTLDALLTLIDGEAAVAEQGGQPDVPRLEDFARYLLTFPECGHHAREDAMLRRLERRAPEVRATIADLMAEHRYLSGLLRRFNAAIAGMRRDSAPSCDWLPALVREIVTVYRRHMWLEEEVLFPAAARHLTAGDWAAIAAEIAAAEDEDMPAAATGLPTALHGRWLSRPLARRWRRVCRFPRKSVG